MIEFQEADQIYKLAFAQMGVRSIEALRQRLTDDTNKGIKFSTVEPEETSSDNTFVGLVSEITGYEFEHISVVSGTKVKWINNHSDFHTVTGESTSDLLDSPQLSQGASYLFKFDKPGKYQFICKFHDDMRATVTVTD